MDLIKMQAQVFEVNTANGWFESDRPFEDDVALLHSEVAEVLEAYRDYGWADGTKPLGQHTIEGSLPKPEGVGAELADVVIRALDSTERHEYTLDTDQAALPVPTMISAVCNQLHRLIVRFEDYPGGVTLGAIVLFVQKVCEHHDYDLEAEVERKLAYNRTRGFRHGNKLL